MVIKDLDALVFGDQAPDALQPVSDAPSLPPTSAAPISAPTPLATVVVSTLAPVISPSARDQGALCRHFGGVGSAREKAHDRGPVQPSGRTVIKRGDSISVHQASSLEARPRDRAWKAIVGGRLSSQQCLRCCRAGAGLRFASGYGEAKGVG